MSRVSLLVVIVGAALLLAACGGGGAAPQATSSGNASDGDKLFHQATLGKNNLPGCATCHSTEKGQVLVGPSLGGIATTAASAFQATGYKGTAKDAAGWLREQITDPNLEITEGFQPGIMPQTYGTDLSAQELNDLVAYLLTLK